MSSEELRLPMPWGHIAAKAWGSPTDERVLMVHGILDNAGTFDRLIPLLPSGYYFVCIDLPGHGLSSHLPAGIPLDYFQYVLAIRRVLDYLNWENCIYIGHSLGAHIGLMFSSIYPERIKRILCLDGVTSAPIPNRILVSYIRRVHDITLSIKADGMAGKLYSYEEVIYTLMHLRKSTLNVAAAEALSKRSFSKVGDKYKLNRDPRLNIGIFPLFNYEQHLTIIKQCKIPAVIIISSASQSLPRYGQLKEIFSEMYTLQKHKFLTVEGNHDVHNNNPERVAPHVSQFLANLRSSL